MVKDTVRNFTTIRKKNGRNITVRLKTKQITNVIPSTDLIVI